MEIPGPDFGLMVEKDQGKLRYEEKRFISFERR